MMTMQPTLLLDYHPQTGVTKWLAFPRRTAPDTARAHFTATYGRPPAAIRSDIPLSADRQALPLAGPVVATDDPAVPKGADK